MRRQRFAGLALLVVCAINLALAYGGNRLVPGTATPRTKSPTEKIADFMASLIPGMNCAHVELRCSSLTAARIPEHQIKIKGARGRLGRKVYFTNWEEWQADHWTLAGADSRTRKPLVTKGTRLRYRGTDAQGRPIIAEIVFGQ